MVRYLILIFALLVSPAIAAPPIYGPLQAQNALSEIATNGAQAEARTNLGAAATINTFTGGNIINMVAAGADPTGATDSAPAIRAALASNRTLFFPPGNYLLDSTQSAPCCAFDNPAVLVQNLHNFNIVAKGAHFIVGSAIALSSAFQFDKDSFFTLDDLSVTPNRTGLTAGQENVGVTFSSDVNFTVDNLLISPGAGGNGAGVAGDWLVNGTFNNVTMQGVGHCYDLAFLNNVSITGTLAYGADTNGDTGTGQVGQTCLSVINDVPNAAQNFTGVNYTETSGVNVSGVNESNFTSGFALSTGKHYSFSGNQWHDNPGIGGAEGLGGYIFYTNGGNTSSVGVPPSDISIADQFYNNGAAVSGAGLAFSTAAITNSDTVSGISLAGSTFNNNTTTGITADASTGLSNVTISPSTVFSGAAQTTAINSALQSILPSYPIAAGQVAQSIHLTGDTTGTAEYVANNKSFEYANGSGSYFPTIGVNPSNILFLRPLSSAAYGQLQDFSGASVLQWGDAGVAIGSKPVTMGGTLGVAGAITSGGDSVLTTISPLSYGNLPALGANQLLGSLTATTPSGLSVPSCSTAGDALYWTAATGFGCFTGYAPQASPTFTGTLSAATIYNTGGITTANNIALTWNDSSGNPKPILSLSNTNVTFTRPGSAAANWEVQNFAGVPEITVQGGSANFIVFGETANLASYTVATLPACTTQIKNGMASVTDATAPTYNGTLTGGGTVDVPVFCNGTNWTAH